MSWVHLLTENDVRVPPPPTSFGIFRAGTATELVARLGLIYICQGVSEKRNPLSFEILQEIIRFE